MCKLNANLDSIAVGILAFWAGVLITAIVINWSVKKIQAKSEFMLECQKELKTCECLVLLGKN